MKAAASVAIEQLAQRLRAVLAGEPEIAAAYLFGSHARGQARADSDLDVGVVYRRRDPTGEQHGRVAVRLGAAIVRAIDFRPRTSSPRAARPPLCAAG